MSKQEDKLFEALCNHFNKSDLYRNWRPEHLRNVLSGKNLEIDIFISRFNVGIEYQGGIHFNNIKRYNNDSDKARKNDAIKSDIILNHSRTFSLVEIFPSDLEGDIIHNVKQRINNTIEFYFNKEKYFKVRVLELLRMYLDFNVKVKGILPGKTNLFDTDTKTRLPLCYNYINWLNTLSKIKKEERNQSLKRCLNPKCDCQTSIFNKREFDYYSYLAN